MRGAILGVPIIRSKYHTCIYIYTLGFIQGKLSYATGTLDALKYPSGSFQNEPWGILIRFI